MKPSLVAVAAELSERVRSRSPLVHQITNYVVMNFTANITLALGAQPVMAHAPEEVEEMVGYASALVLNLGTLEPYWIDAMVKAGKGANARGVPVVLDPVGAGATRLRTDAARRILDEVRVAVVRGNAGEVLAVAGDAGKVRGVDSLADTESARKVALLLASERKTVVAVTGAVDVVTDGSVSYDIANGSPLLGRVTGTGCGATTAIGCFLGVADKGQEAIATASALARYGLAGEMAASKAGGPGSFVPAFLDALYLSDTELLAPFFKMQER